jgi:hypothetical protein
MTLQDACHKGCQPTSGLPAIRAASLQEMKSMGLTAIRAASEEVLAPQERQHRI